MGRPWTKKVDRKRTQNTASSHISEKQKLYPFLLAFFILFSVWVLLSGRLDTFHLILGIFSSGLVACFSGDLLFASPNLRGLPSFCVRFLAYLPWLLYQIFLANLHVMYLVFHPNMMELIDPHILRFRSKLKSDLSLVTLANSITLTPGTITVFASVDGDFQVHAIDEKSREALPGEMEARIAKAFGEE